MALHTLPQEMRIWFTKPETELKIEYVPECNFPTDLPMMENAPLELYESKTQDGVVWFFMRNISDVTARLSFQIECAIAGHASTLDYGVPVSKLLICGQTGSILMMPFGRTLAQMGEKPNFKKMVDCISTMHDLGVWHSDLRTQNICINAADEYRILGFENAWPMLAPHNRFGVPYALRLRDFITLKHSLLTTYQDEFESVYMNDRSFKDAKNVEYAKELGDLKKLAEDGTTFQIYQHAISRLNPTDVMHIGKEVLLYRMDASITPEEKATLGDSLEARTQEFLLDNLERNFVS